MATSQQWQRGSLKVAATLLMLFKGFADAACYSARDCPGKANAIAACTSGVCKYTCKAGWANCDNIWGNGCEINTDTDVNKCGSCGLQCIPYHAATVITKCSKGKCVYTCKPGLSDCNNWLNDGCESRLPYNDDARFCGACDTPCLGNLPNAFSNCIRGKCVYTCYAGYGNCDNNWKNGCEENLSNNINHCNRCGAKCQVTLIGGEATCRKGKCGQQCKKGTRYDSKTRKCVQSY